MRYELSNEEWSAIKPMLPDKPPPTSATTELRPPPNFDRDRSIVPESPVRLRVTGD
jgi:transposase